MPASGSENGSVPTDSGDRSASLPPRWDEEPEVVKFVRADCIQYEGEWEPDRYDPVKAHELFESNIEDAIEAERLGFDGIVNTEHHFDAWTMVPSPSVYLAALARETTRIRLGTSVHLLSIHNPWRLAEEYGMLDMLSNGRAEIGVGKGNFSCERIRYSPEAADLEPRFDEGLQLLTRALGETKLSFDGKYHKVRQPSTVYPKPFNIRPRIWIPATRPASVERVGELGHNLYGFMAPDAVGNLERYIEAGQRCGHELSGANYMLATSLIIAPTDREAEKLQAQARKIGMDSLLRRGLPEQEAKVYNGVFGGAIVGAPNTVLDQLTAGLQQAGARRLNLTIRLRSFPEEVSRQTMQLFAADVMPHLRNLPVAEPAHATSGV